MSERYEFMRTQHEDLVMAQAELKKIIEELDTGMRRQFDEKFREIRAEFDKVFKELFGGGRGTLELFEGEDILEAGIRSLRSHLAKASEHDAALRWRKRHCPLFPCCLPSRI